MNYEKHLFASNRFALFNLKNKLTKVCYKRQDNIAFNWNLIKLQISNKELIFNFIKRSNLAETKIFFLQKVHRNISAAYFRLRPSKQTQYIKFCLNVFFPSKFLLLMNSIVTEGYLMVKAGSIQDDFTLIYSVLNDIIF